MRASTQPFDKKDPKQDELKVYTLTLDELAAKLDTDIKQGLSHREAEERRRTYGPNIVHVNQSLFKIYIAPFLNWLISIYLIVSFALALLAFFLLPDLWWRVAYWLLLIAVNIIITIAQEARAQT